LLVHYNLSTTEPAHPRCGLPVDDDDRWFPPQAFRLPAILSRHSSKLEALVAGTLQP